jgi:SAM-dependent methyltransferase
MGISITPARFLFSCGQQFGSFGKTLTLGALGLHVKDKPRLLSMANRFGFCQGESQEEFNRRFEGRRGAEPLISILGADPIESLDISAYQGATIVHDLNTPLPAEYRNTYDCVIDGGTLEHVFNTPVALTSIMQILKPGGLYLCITTGNNFFCHGFYQFGAEVFYRSFCERNGFEMLACETQSDKRFIKVDDPPRAAEKIPQWTVGPSRIFVAARKVADVKPFDGWWPVQGKYEAPWSEHEQKLAAAKG